VFTNPSSKTGQKKSVLKLMDFTHTTIKGVDETGFNDISNLKKSPVFFKKGRFFRGDSLNNVLQKRENPKNALKSMNVRRIAKLIKEMLLP
jgi:hypothetical protein